jgi:hypothetical protein
MRGWKDKLQERFGSEAKEFGRAVAERCNDCRWQYAGCMKERKDEDPKAAHDACFLRFESCAAPAGLNRAGGLACHSPPLWNLR